MGRLQRFSLRCKTTCYFGVGAIEKFRDISEWFVSEGIKKVIVVSDPVAYKITGAWDKVEKFLREKDIEYVIYDKVTPNPTTTQIDEATELGLDFGAQAVIGIGGGSPIDTVKSVAVLLEYTNRTGAELYEGKFIPKKAKPIIAINTTHGTGTEVARFAVASILEKEYKPAIAYDCIYPTFAIDDPQALSNPNDLTARYYLLYASAIAGISFDNGLLHFTHALEHPLSTIKPELPHGLGLAMLLPAVIKEIYPFTLEILAEIYEPIVPGLKGVPGESEVIAKKVEEWLFDMGITQKLSDRYLLCRRLSSFRGRVRQIEICSCCVN